MSKTKIPWATDTWNPYSGCTPISAGCKHCYAKPMATRLAAMGMPGYDKANPFRVTFHENRLDEPLHWRKPRTVFVCSMGDLFHENVDPENVGRIFDIMQATPRHRYLLLTKRPKRMGEWLGDWAVEGGWPLPNVYLGVTVENQKRADERIPVLLKIPAAKHFVSIEPMLGPVNLSGTVSIPWMGGESRGGRDYSLWTSHLDGVILGGESGPRARPMHPDWARHVRDQCRQARVPFHFKQWGEYAYAKVEDDASMTEGRAFDNPLSGRSSAIIRLKSTKAFHSGTWRLMEPGDETVGGVIMLDRDNVAIRVGTKRTGHLLDGVEWRQFPKMEDERWDA